MVVRINIKLAAKKKFIIQLTDEQIQTATVKWLKLRIEFLEGTPVKLQQLIYKEKQLEDSRLLQDYGIKDESIIHMCLIMYFIPVDPGNEAGAMGDQSGENQSEHKSEVEATNKYYKRIVRIIIEILTVKKFIIELTDGLIETATVECLKTMIKYQVGTPVELQRLIYKGEQLEDSRLLQDYGVKDESILHICEHKSAVEATEEHRKRVVRINIKMVTGKEFIIKLTNERFQTATVEWLKNMIEYGFGIAVELQRLIYIKQLENSRLLRDYGIRDESLLYMTVKPSFIPMDPGNEAGAMGGQSGEKQSEHKSALEATDKHHKMVVRIDIKLLTKREVTIKLNNECFQRCTVESLKKKIEFLTGIADYRYHLIYKRIWLEDFRLLSYYGVKDESIIDVVPRLPGGGPLMYEYGGMGDKRGINQSFEMLLSL